jgi:hypothetical protein
MNIDFLSDYQPVSTAENEESAALFKNAVDKLVEQYRGKDNFVEKVVPDFGNSEGKHVFVRFEDDKNSADIFRFKDSSKDDSYKVMVSQRDYDNDNNAPDSTMRRSITYQSYPNSQFEPDLKLPDIGRGSVLRRISTQQSLNEPAGKSIGNLREESQRVGKDEVNDLINFLHNLKPTEY